MSECKHQIVWNHFYFCKFCNKPVLDLYDEQVAEIEKLRAENERLKGEVQQLCLDASPPPDPPKSIKLVSGVQGKSGGVHQPRKQASPEAAPDAVGFPPDTDITDCDLIAALRDEVERLKLNMDWQEAEKLLDELISLSSRAEQAEVELGGIRGIMATYGRIEDTAENLVRKMCKDFDECLDRLEHAEAKVKELEERSRCNHEWKEWTSTAGAKRQCGITGKNAMTWALRR